MRYKISSQSSSVFSCLRFLLSMHTRYLLFILQSSRIVSPFAACYLFLPLISPRTLSFLSSSFQLLPIPPTSLLPPLPHSLSVFCTFLLALSVFLHPATHPLSLHFPLWWMSLSAGCSSYLLSRGAHTVSLSRPPHLYPSTKETERARGYSGMRGGGRPWSRDPLQQSPGQQLAWWRTR